MEYKISLNKNNIIKLNLIIILLLSLCNYDAQAIPASNNIVSIQQPDGISIDVYVRGDEKINYLESIEGYTLLKDSNNNIMYAKLDNNGNLIPSEYRYFPSTVRRKMPAEFSDFKNSLQKKLYFSKSQIENKLSKWEIPNKIANFSSKIKEQLQGPPADIQGKRKYVVILMEYTDMPFNKTRQEFDDLYNMKDYSGAVGKGSVRDYYEENSYGKFIPEFTVLGPYKTIHPMSYYKERGAELALEAIENADYYVNFAQFDNDDDGAVDAVNIIFAGWGQESGYQNGIWSHAGYLLDSNWDFPYYDGRVLRRYCCSPELRGNGGNVISSIGVSCHEFCHTLGAPDYYDVDYATNGQYPGAGSWCLMANGSWNGNGDCPAGINIFQKSMFNWVTPEVLSTESIEIINMQNSAHNSVAYRIDTDTPNEYFVMENRQQIGFDKYIPGHGLLIWHIHSQMLTNLDSGINNGNSKHPQMMYPVCAASTFAIPNSDPTSYGSINSMTCPFPGSANKTSFKDNTIPALKSWNNKNLNKPISFISEIDSFINFNYVGRPEFVFTPPYQYNFSDAAHFNNYYKSSNLNSNLISWERYTEPDGNLAGYLRCFNDPSATLEEHLLFLPPFSLLSGYTYKFDFLNKIRSNVYPGNIKILLGRTNNYNEERTNLLEIVEIINESFNPSSVSFSVPEDGIYFITLSSYSSGTAMNLYVDNLSLTGTVGIENDFESTENKQTQFTIYPNPADGIITIENPNNIEIINIKITDINGAIFYNNNNNISNKIIGNRIDISTLPNGTYFINIFTKNQTQIKKIIKQ